MSSSAPLKKEIRRRLTSNPSMSSFPSSAQRRSVAAASSPPLLLLSSTPFLLLLAAILLLASSAQCALAGGSYELSAEPGSSELHNKRTLPYVSYQPWSYMKRAPAAPIIRFGKRGQQMMVDAEWESVGSPYAGRNVRAALNGPLIRFGKRVPSGAPLIRFGRRDSAPLIRFGKRAAPNRAPLIRFGRSSDGTEQQQQWAEEEEE